MQGDDDVYAQPEGRDESVQVDHGKLPWKVPARIRLHRRHRARRARKAPRGRKCVDSTKPREGEQAPDSVNLVTMGTCSSRIATVLTTVFPATNGAISPVMELTG
jgi:hypothetical protein